MPAICACLVHHVGHLSSTHSTDLYRKSSEDRESSDALTEFAVQSPPVPTVEVDEVVAADLVPDVKVPSLVVLMRELLEVVFLCDLPCWLVVAAVPRLARHEAFHIETLSLVACLKEKTLEREK